MTSRNRFSQTGPRTQTRSWRLTRPPWLLVPLLLALSLTPSSARAQQPSASQCAATDYRCQLKQALDRITDLKTQLDTIPPLVEAIKQERVAAAAERESAAREREAADRAFKKADAAIAAQQVVIDAYEKRLIPAYDKLVDKQAARVDKLEERLDKANKRTVLGTLLGFVGGALTKVF